MEYGYFDSKRRHIIWVILGIPVAAMLLSLGTLPISAMTGPTVQLVIGMVVAVLVGGAHLAANLIASKFIIGIQYKLAFSLVGVASLLAMLFNLFVQLQDRLIHQSALGQNSILTIELAFLLLIVGVLAGAFGIFAFTDGKKHGLVFGFSLSSFIILALMFLFCAVYLVLSASMPMNSGDMLDGFLGSEVLIWLSIIGFAWLQSLLSIGFFLGLFFASSRRHEIGAEAEPQAVAGS
ncbi:MAG: hypothetical protein ACOYI4_02330 [Christensenellales bacterium]|jgi:hypothetical protein